VYGVLLADPTPADWTPFAGEHFYVHGAIPHGDRSYVALVDAGLAILDISDITKPKTISHIDWSPPFGGYAHTTLPLPGRKLVVAVDESVKYDCQERRSGCGSSTFARAKPVIVSTCPVPQGVLQPRPALRSA
jgi:hypothetical protein